MYTRVVRNSLPFFYEPHAMPHGLSQQINKCGRISSAPRLLLYKMMKGDNTIYNRDGSVPTDAKELASSKKRRKNATTAATTANNRGAPAACSTGFDACMASCGGPAKGGLFGWHKTPKAGTCTFVCTVVQQGCTRCAFECATILALTNCQRPQ